MKRLAIITTHPIQYNAPLFRLLTNRRRIEIRVFYTWGDTVLKQKFDPGFGKTIDWDIPLLEGYDYHFLENTAKDKGSHHFNGIINPGIIEAVTRYRPDAILVFGWSFHSHLKVMRHFKNKIPVLFRGDSTLLDDMGLFKSLMRNVLLRWVYSFVDTALYVGKNNYDYFQKAGLLESQLVFAPHAVDNERFACSSLACKQEAKAFRDNLSIPGTDLVFLYAGKLEAKKDVEILLRAFWQSNFEKNVHLVVAGNGALEKNLKNGFQTENIHFMGFQNQGTMPSLYEMADVFVLPSKGPGETWGLSVNEAMANGKAIIVSDKCGCYKNLVDNGENGYVFEAEKLEDLKSKMQLISNDNWMLEQMKNRSLEKIKRYSLENLSVAIEKTVVVSLN